MNALNTRAMNRFGLPALATVLLASAGPVSVAAPPVANGSPIITVKYDPSEAATPAGAQALYTRIKAAATNACDPYESRELVRHVVWQKCYSAAVTRAVAAVHQPILTALHERSGDGRGATDPRG